MKNKRKQALDYIPFILLIVYGLYQWLTFYVVNIQIPIRTYIGIAFLIVNAVVYTKRHQHGVLLTGLICFLGIFGLLMLSPARIGIKFESLPIRFGDFYFTTILIIHFLVSSRYYVGIASKRYWKNLSNQRSHKDEP